MNNWIHSFDDPLTDKINQTLIGNKGYNLCLMHNLGLPIPEGFIINSDSSRFFIENSKFDKDFDDILKKNLKKIEEKTNLEIGNNKKPLILSIRSGSKVSMPGMLDTILNIGLTKEIVKSLSANGNDFFAYDTWRRFIQMYSHVVYKIDNYDFDEILENYLLGANLSSVSQLDHEDLEEICDMYLNLFKESAGKEFPGDPYEQIKEGIIAVINSWDNERAISYRNINNIPDDIGFAVTIQRMVFGNLNTKSASGVIFTRNPDTGENKIKGEYLIESQGEDVVSGFVTPKNINEINDKKDSFIDIFPDAYSEIKKISKQLESFFGFVQDIEFTIEAEKLWVLQSRDAEVNALALFRILNDMVNEKIINKVEAIKLIKEEHIENSLFPILDDSQELNILTKGLPASPGVIGGKVVFNLEGIQFVKNEGKNAILVLTDTKTNDIKAMHASDGILTSRGGLTSHAAVVARGLGKPCVTGAREVVINSEKKIILINDFSISEFEEVSLNGYTGEVIEGIARTKPQDPPNTLKEILIWCEEITNIKNAKPLLLIKEAKLKNK